MRIGSEGNHIVDVKRRGWRGSFDFAHEHGLDGIFFKSIFDLSPTLDYGELREAKAYADSLRLYVEAGVGRINPYNIPEDPHIRQFGGGDYRKAMEVMIRACREIDCVSLWAETAGIQRHTSRGIYIVDRFRTDAPWADQLAATAKFLKMLQPVLLDLGCKISIETHEDVTSFEVVRLVEEVGPDVTGITFDTGNVLARCEDPIAAARRVAPYCLTTHTKDGILFFDEYGLVRQNRACGEGVIDWDTVIGILAEHNPKLNLSLEDSNARMPIEIWNPAWQAGHPDLTVAEVAELVRLAKRCEAGIADGTIMHPDVYDPIPYEEKSLAGIYKSQEHLRPILDRRGLAEPSPVPA
jgi:sugar phosphate isomerase/epimerase